MDDPSHHKSPPHCHFCDDCGCTDPECFVDPINPAHYHLCIYCMLDRLHRWAYLDWLEENGLSEHGPRAA